MGCEQPPLVLQDLDLIFNVLFCDFISFYYFIWPAEETRAWQQRGSGLQGYSCWWGRTRRPTSPVLGTSLRRQWRMELGSSPFPCAHTLTLMLLHLQITQKSIALTPSRAGVLQLPLLERLFPYVCRASPRRAFGGHAARGCPQALCVPRWRCACPRPSSLTHSEGVGLTQRMCHDAGSIPEREGDKLYNTSVVYDPQGNLIAKHRKVWSLSTKCLLEPPLMNESFLQLHLFDINVPPGEGRPGMTFKYVATQSLSSCGSWSLTLLVRWAGNQTRFRPEATSPPLQQVFPSRGFSSSTRGSSCAYLVHCHVTLIRVV